MTSCWDRLRGLFPVLPFGPGRRQRCYVHRFAVTLCAMLCSGVALANASGVHAAQPGTQAVSAATAGQYTGLPLPRFASLRSGRVNLRRGPGRRYPIDWVLYRRFLPIEILREFQNWRFVHIPDGTEGWVHTALLAGRRSFVVNGATARLRRAPRPNADVVALLMPGVIGRLVACEPRSAWCKAETTDHVGYIRRSALWGVLPGEAIVD